MIEVNPWSRRAGGPCPCRCRRSQRRSPRRELQPKQTVLFSLEFPFLHATRYTLRASLHRWSPAEGNGSPAPQTVGHFKGGLCPWGHSYAACAAKPAREPAADRLLGTHHSPSP